MAELIENKKESYTHSHFLVQDGEVIGALKIVKDFTRFKIYNVGILKDYQNCGFGTEMMEHLIKLSKDEGAKKLWLWVEKKNTRAKHVYEKVGFKVTVNDDFTYEMELKL